MKILPLSRHRRLQVGLAAAAGLAVALLPGFTPQAQAASLGLLQTPAGPPITGRIVDEKGEPLPGANVIVKGTANGTATNADGQYTINAPAGSTLVFSFVGYPAQEVTLNGRTTVDVKFAAPQAQSLNDVVVVGYGTQAKREITGAIASVKGDELVNQASQNPISSIQGKVAGVQITNSGTPGGAPQITIRGTGSISGAAPLYVVDGTMLPAGADLSFLNQADIASLEVLKDAASASIYGVQAANGVVIVTTKRGMAGTPHISYNGFVGVQTTTNKVKMADGAEYTTLYNEKNILQGNTTATNLPTTGLASTDWYNQISRNAFTQNHQLSVSGGSEKISYSFSGSYLKQQGLISTNDYERITARLQTDFSLTDHIKVGYNALLANTKSNDIPGNIFQQAYVAPSVLPVYQANGNYGDPSLIGSGGLGSFANPQASLDYYHQQTRGQSLIANAFASINFLKYLTVRSSVGVNYLASKYYNYQPKDSLTAVQYTRTSLLTRGNRLNSQLTWENTLTYDRSFGDHHLTLLAGTTALNYQVDNVVASINGVTAASSDNYYFSLGTPGTATLTNPGLDAYRVFSLFGRVNYAYKGRYLLTASIRRDGASQFSERYGNFPSVGAGWVISDEPFMQDNSVFSFLKLRASYGVLGNNRVANNVTISTVTIAPGLGAPIGGTFQTGGNLVTQTAPTLRWETAHEADAGLEMRFFSNHLTAEFDYYNRRTIDAVFPVPVLAAPGYTNNTAYYANNANFQNQGVEAALRWNSQGAGDFSYNLGVTAAYNQNKVLATASGAPLSAGALPVAGYLSTITQVGSPLGAFYGYRVDGVFQSDAEATTSAQPGAHAGDLRYQDVNGDGVIDNRDYVMLGNPNPRLTYGINTYFRYKGFDLQVDFQGVAGVEILNALREVRYGNENYTQDFYNTRWHGAGTSNTTPSANLTGHNLDVSSYYVEKGDYIRLRNLQLGYNLSKALASNLRVQGIRIYVNAQNPVTWTKYKGFTPEVGGTPTNAGIDLNVYPIAATYNFGVNVNF